MTGILFGKETTCFRYFNSVFSTGIFSGYFILFSATRLHWASGGFGFWLAPLVTVVFQYSEGFGISPLKEQGDFTFRGFHCLNLLDFPTTPR